jgi:transposase
LARGRMRSKISDLERALEGRFDDHHALMCRLHLAQLDQLDAMVATLDEQVLVECAWAAVRTDGFLREFYRRQVRQFGGFRSPAAKKKAIVAVAHKLIVIIWHVLATGRPYQDLGADYFTTRIDPEKERRRLIAKLEAHGFKVTLEPAA